MQSEIYQNSLANKNHHNLFEKVVSDENILQAIFRVSNNPGRNTPGPNGKSFSDLMEHPTNQVISIIKDEIYAKKKQRLARQAMIPKSNGGLRPLGITDIENRIAQQAVLNILECIVEPHFVKNSFGFRRNLSAKHCVSKIALNLKIKKGNKYIYDCDLENYFGTVNLDNVITLLRKNHRVNDGKFLGLIKKLMWLDVKFMKTITKYKGIGLAQGTILGPTLANVQFHDFEILLEKYQANHREKERIAIYSRKYDNGFYDEDKFNEMRKNSGLDKVHDVSMFRYADDFIFISTNKFDLEWAIKTFKDWTRKNGLKVNEAKTNIISGNEIKLDFLGYTIRVGEKDFLLSIKNYKEYKINFIKKVKKYLREGNVDMLNATINGTLYYYDLATNLMDLGRTLSKVIYRYIKRRQSFSTVIKIPNHDRYIVKGKNGKETMIDFWSLRRESKNSVKYYLTNCKYWIPTEDNNTSIITWMEEFIKNHEKYLSPRLMGFVITKLRTQKKEPVLQIPILTINPKEIHVHHRKPRSKGGKDEYNNIVLIHKRVHVSLHSNNECVSGWYKPNYNKLLKQINE